MTADQSICPECHGNMVETTTTLHYEFGDVSVEISDVPAWVCSNCNKRLIRGDVAHQIVEILRQVEAEAGMEQLRKDVDRLRRRVSQVRSASLQLDYA